MAIPPKNPDWKIELKKAAKESCEKNKVEQWLDEKIKAQKKDTIEMRNAKNKSASNIESNKRVETFKKIYISELELSKISEIFLIKTIKENSSSIEIIIKIGETTVEIGKINEKRNQFENTYLGILPVLSNFDNIYGTKHEVVKEDSWADMKYFLKTEVRIPITSSKRTEILQIFFNSKWGKLYQQIKSSTLYSAITEKMHEYISNVITSSYNNQNSSANISFYVAKRYVSGFRTINFLEIGYGEMSEDACWIIALLIHEYTYDCCLQQDLLKQMTSSIFKEDNEYSSSPSCIRVGFYMELKPNTNLISW